jgi:digeranylgeranylglycerophospholipid reductase
MANEMYDVAIIGASVAGNRVAEIIAKKGYRVLLIEEHKKIGFPSKCTGLVSHRIKELLPELDERIIQNEVNRAEFVFKDNRFELKSKNPMYVLDRPKLDKFLFDRAIAFGSEVKLGEKFIRVEKFTNSYKIFTNSGEYNAKILVGADGAFSQVAKNFNLYEENEFLIGVQATVDGKFERDKVELWFGDFARDFFGWVVPINERYAKVGLATKGDVYSNFKKFLRKRVRKFVQPDTGGIIKFGLIKSSVAERVLLVGDAAMQMKPFSGGGIIYSLIASQLAALAILKALAKNDFSKEFFEENYEKEWKKKLTWPIIKGILIRKLFYGLGEISMDFWFFVLPYLKSIIENLDVDFY